MHGLPLFPYVIGLDVIDMLQSLGHTFIPLFQSIYLYIELKSANFRPSQEFTLLIS